MKKHLVCITVFADFGITKVPVKKKSQGVRFDDSVDADGNQSDGNSDDSDYLMAPVQTIHNHRIEYWDTYIRRWIKDKQRESLSKISLTEANVVHTYPIVWMPELDELYVELNLDLPDNFPRFGQTFDLRKYVFFTKHPNRHWKFSELWDMRVPITIKINGVTLFRISKLHKELTISFPNDVDAEEIMSGIGKSDKLSKLTLINTPIPSRIRGFPARYLEHICFYGVKIRDEYDLGDLFKRCRNLVELSCYASTNCNASVVDLHSDLTSGDKLQRIVLFNVLLYVPCLQKPAAFEGVKLLYLDQCIWTASLADIIHLVFPNLERLAIRQRRSDPKEAKRKAPSKDTKSGTPRKDVNLETPPEETNCGTSSEVTSHETTSQDKSYYVTTRMLFNVLKIKSLGWIRIWGVNWNEKRSAKPDGSPSKNLRNKPSVISDEEVAMVQSVLQNSGLRKETCNFILEKKSCEDNACGSVPEAEKTACWVGQELNENEDQEDDHGYWDLMDRLEFDMFSLNNAYNDYKTFQNSFSCLQ
jgi:hypothetical protein